MCHPQCERERKHVSLAANRRPYEEQKYVGIKMQGNEDEDFVDKGERQPDKKNYYDSTNATYTWLYT